MSCGCAKLPDASATSPLPAELLTTGIKSGERPQRWVRGNRQADGRSGAVAAAGSLW
jgi:hypothetical protein